MKTNYPIEIIRLKCPPDHTLPKKGQFFQEYGANTDTARLFLKLIRRREIDLISDGNKLIEVKAL